MRRSPKLAETWDKTDVRRAIDTLEDRPRLPSFTVAQAQAVASAALEAGMLIFVTNEAGGAQPAFWDGSNWRRFTDRAVIS